MRGLAEEHLAEEQQPAAGDEVTDAAGEAGPDPCRRES
jgi:hypothetical protein